MKLGHDVIDATKYPDILELIVACEILLTDYSSCIFDAAVINKKAMLFALDEEEYNKERGLYMHLEETPFLVSRNNNELIENIQKFDEEKYYKKVEEYFDKVGLIKDGKATSKIVDIIIDRLEEKI